MVTNMGAHIPAPVMGQWQRMVVEIPEDVMRRLRGQDSTVDDVRGADIEVHRLLSNNSTPGI